MCQNAATPSFQPIFLPSAYVRPEYEIGTSKMRAFALASCAVTSGSNPNRSDVSVSPRATSPRMALYQVSMSVRLRFVSMLLNVVSTALPTECQK